MNEEMIKEFQEEFSMMQQTISFARIKIHHAIQTVGPDSKIDEVIECLRDSLNYLHTVSRDLKWAQRNLK